MASTTDSERAAEADRVIDLRTGSALGGTPTLRESPEPARPAVDTTDAARSSTGMGYLPALDGLRAIAVLAVLAYHADLSWAQGGFLGVDVFFVLSGFLITALLLQAVARNDALGLRQFYVRRARRLLPALFAVLIGSTLLVITVATDDAGNQQRDLPAALTYVTNWVYVLTDQSYFEATGRPPMLEHLWSLAVEEQFYLLWPWVFLLAWRLGRTTRVRRFALVGAAVSTGLMAVSCIIHGYPVPNDPSRVYFGTDTHAMGLLVGAALATVWNPRRARGDLLPGARAAWDGIAALALIALAVVFWQTSEHSPLLYRGGFALLSVLVALIIVATTHPASRIGIGLGSAPLRYLGSRSYGIYLWHWPVFLVTRPGLDVGLTGAANLALRLGLTLGIAELSYRFLESPIRRHGFRAAWQMLLARLAAGPRHVAALGRRPVLIVAIVSALLAVMLLRLYTLPSEPDYLAGVTSLSATEGLPTHDGAEPVVPEVGDGQLGIGESVMIGASGALERQFPGIAIDAEVGRQQRETIQRVAQLAASGALHEETILHVGSNGPVTEHGVREIINTLVDAGVDSVAVVNVSVPRRWQDPNNEILARVAEEYDNAALVDWHAEVMKDPSLVNADGVHPSSTGTDAYAAVIASAFAELDPADGTTP